MPIEKNQVVLFHYSVSDEQGNVFENSRGGEPNAYLHGHGGIIRGLDEALEGHPIRRQYDIGSAVVWR